MEKTISLRIENKLIEKIDLMVKKGIYNDRSDLIREAIQLLVDGHGNKISDKYIIANLISNYLFFSQKDYIQAVILFGSVAEGFDTEESDIDLLILTKKEISYKEKFRITNRIVSLLDKLNYIVSLHFQHINDFIQAIEDNYNFEKKILEKGEVLVGNIESK
jgi:predicted nucleotidyltransferase